jgi:hypothetical protein
LAWRWPGTAPGRGGLRRLAARRWAELLVAELLTADEWLAMPHDFIGLPAELEAAFVLTRAPPRVA